MNEPQELFRTLQHFNDMGSIYREQKAQTEALYRQLGIHQETREFEKRRAETEEDRLRTEKERLMIEKKRAAAEESEREMHRQQLVQAKMLRNLIADATISIARFRAQHLR